MPGFESPNYTQAPNDLFDIYMRDMGEAELRVVMAVIRYTFGYHRDECTLSIRDLAEITGLSKSNVIAGVDQAIARELIEKITDGNKSTTWRVVTVPATGTQGKDAYLLQVHRVPATGTLYGLNKDKEKEVKESISAASISPDVILCNASRLSAFPADQLQWIEVIIRLAQDYGVEKTTAAMKKACDEWTSTLGKSGRAYKKTNLSWINWAQEELANDGKPPAIDPSKPMTDAEFIRYHKLGEYAEEP